MAKPAAKKAAKAAPAKKAAAPASETKSIVDPKYRDKYKNTGPDWLGAIIISVAQPLVEKTVKVTDEAGSKTKTVKVPGDVDVKALFGLATENGLDIKKYKAQEGTHGFAGRMRMTIRNMLQAVAKQRHGITVGGTFKKAPAEWLAEKKAPDAPTHGKDGVKIAVKKPAKEKAATA